MFPVGIFMYVDHFFVEQVKSVLKGGWDIQLCVCECVFVR